MSNIYKLVARSENTNSFGLRELLLVNKAGQGYTTCANYLNDLKSQYILEGSIFRGCELTTKLSMPAPEETVARAFETSPLVINKVNEELFKLSEFSLNKIVPEPTHEHTFRAYDDDGIFYYSGTCDFDQAEAVADWCEWDSGCTQVKFYDRKTNKYIDEIS